MNTSSLLSSLPSSLCDWRSCLIFTVLTSSLWLLLLLPQFSSPSSLLLSLAGPSGLSFSLALGFTLLATSATITNSAIFTAFGPLSRTETSIIGQKLANDNVFLQILLLAINEPNTNSLEIVLWTGVLVVYTSLRVCLSACEARLETNSSGLNSSHSVRLLTVVVSASVFFISVSSWVFWPVGLALLIQMHYEGVQIVLIAIGHIVGQRSESGEFVVTEIVLTGLAHAVALTQWCHFLLDSVAVLGFPIQFFLFYKLGRAIHQVRMDVWRYTGFRQSTKALLETCPVLREEELEGTGEERCCMCWEALREFEAARLPCKHVHHV